MSDSVLGILILIVGGIILKLFNNFIYMKYKNSKYKIVAYSLLFVIGSLIIFILLYYSRQYFNS